MVEVSENNLQDVLNNKDYRWDSDFYTTKIFYNKKLNYKPIGEVITKSQYGISRSMNDEKGVPIYRMNEIHNMLCNNHVDKLVEMTANEIENYKLEDRDVLFNRPTLTNLLEEREFIIKRICPIRYLHRIW